MLGKQLEAIKGQKILSNEEFAAVETAKLFIANDQIVTFRSLDEITTALEQLWEKAISLQDFHADKKHQLWAKIAPPKDKKYFADSVQLDTISYHKTAPEPSWSIRLSPEFTKSISKIDKKLKGRVLEAITKVVESPTTISGNTIKPLTNDLKGFWRYRIGDYRLIYSPLGACRGIKTHDPQ